MLVCGRRTGISAMLDDANRCRFEAIATDRNAPQKQVWRDRDVLLNADG